MAKKHKRIVQIQTDLDAINRAWQKATLPV